MAVAGSLYSSNQAAKSSAKQAGMMSRADNEAVVRSNTQSMIRNHYKAGMMNLQLGLSKKQAIQEGFDTGIKAQQALGAVNSNQAAAGTVGATADAVTNDIQMRWGEAQAMQRESAEAELTNYNNQLEALSLSADGEVQHERRYEYNGPSSGEMWTGALLAGLGSFMGTYGAKKMSLNLGQSTAPAASLSTGTGGGFNGLRY